MITSGEEFVRLRTSESPEEYRRAAHEAASDEVWQDVIRLYPDMRFWVAHNKTISRRIMELLSQFEDTRVLSMLASKRKCPPSILAKLAVHPDESVRNAVATNKKTPVSILQLLTKDEWESCAENARRNLDSRRLRESG
jgi:hypothetical protein